MEKQVVWFVLFLFTLSFASHYDEWKVASDEFCGGSGYSIVSGSETDGCCGEPSVVKLAPTGVYREWIEYCFASPSDNAKLTSPITVSFYAKRCALIPTYFVIVDAFNWEEGEYEEVYDPPDNSCGMFSFNIGEDYFSKTSGIKLRFRADFGDCIYLCGVGVEFDYCLPPSIPTELDERDITDSSATICWNSVYDATGYYYYYSTSSSTPGDDGIYTSSTRVHLSDLDCNTHYYWWVRAVNSCGSSDWSSRQDFYTDDCPEPVCNPAGMSARICAHVGETKCEDIGYIENIGTGDLYLYDVNLPDHFSISPSPSYLHPIIIHPGEFQSFRVCYSPERDDDNVPTTTISFTTNCSDSRCDFSNVAGGVIPDPPEHLEEESIECNSARICWDRVDGVEDYYYYYSTNPSEPATEEGNYKHSSSARICADLSELSENEDYYWWVRAVGYMGCSSEWSDRQHFETPDCPCPPPDEPENLRAEVDGNEVTLRCDEVENADYYYFYISRHPGSPDEGVRTTHPYLDTILENSTYDWWVQTENECGRSDLVSGGTFTISVCPRCEDDGRYDLDLSLGASDGSPEITVNVDDLPKTVTLRYIWRLVYSTRPEDRIPIRNCGTCIGNLVIGDEEYCLAPASSEGFNYITVEIPELPVGIHHFQVVNPCPWSDGPFHYMGDSYTLTVNVVGTGGCVLNSIALDDLPSTLCPDVTPELILQWTLDYSGDCVPEYSVYKQIDGGSWELLVEGWRSDAWTYEVQPDDIGHTLRFKVQASSEGATPVEDISGNIQITCGCNVTVSWIRQPPPNAEVGDNFELRWEETHSGSSCPSTTPHFILQKQRDAGTWTTIYEGSDNVYNYEVVSEDAGSNIRFRIKAQLGEYESSYELSNVCHIEEVACNINVNFTDEPPANVSCGDEITLRGVVSASGACPSPLNIFLYKQIDTGAWELVDGPTSISTSTFEYNYTTESEDCGHTIRFKVRAVAGSFSDEDISSSCRVNEVNECRIVSFGFSEDDAERFLYDPDDPSYTGDPYYGSPEWYIIPDDEEYIQLYLIVEPPEGESVGTFTGSIRMSFGNPDILEDVELIPTFTETFTGRTTIPLTPIYLDDMLDYGVIYIDLGTTCSDKALVVAKSGKAGSVITDNYNDYRGWGEETALFDCLISIGSDIIPLSEKLNNLEEGYSLISDGYEVLRETHDGLDLSDLNQIRAFGRLAITGAKIAMETKRTECYIEVGATMEGCMVVAGIPDPVDGTIIGFAAEWGTCVVTVTATCYTYTTASIVLLDASLCAESWLYNVTCEGDYNQCAEDFVNWANDEFDEAFETASNVYHGICNWAASAVNWLEHLGDGKEITDVFRCPVEPWVTYHGDTMFFSGDTLYNHYTPGIMNHHDGVNTILTAVDDSTIYHFTWQDSGLARIRISDNRDTLHHLVVFDIALPINGQAWYDFGDTIPQLHVDIDGDDVEDTVLFPEIDYYDNFMVKISAVDSLGNEVENSKCYLLAGPMFSDSFSYPEDAMAPPPSIDDTNTRIVSQLPTSDFIRLIRNSIYANVSYDSGYAAWIINVEPGIGHSCRIKFESVNDNDCYNLLRGDSTLISSFVGDTILDLPTGEYILIVAHNPCILNEIKVGIFRGWNLLSSPVSGEQDIRNVISGTAAISPVYAYDIDSGGYYATNIVHPGQGFFLLSSENDSIKWCSPGINTISLHLNIGWNLVGFTSDTIDVSELYAKPFIIYPIYGFDPERRCYVIVDSVLVPGKAYWIASMADTTITIGE